MYVCIYINLCLKTFLIEKTNCLRVSAYFFLILHFFTWRVRNKQSRVCVCVTPPDFVGDPKYKVTAGHDASIAIVLCRLSPVAYHPAPPTPPPWKFHHTSSKALTPTNNSKSFWTLNKCSNPVQVLTRALFLMDVSLQRAIHHPI